MKKTLAILLSIIIILSLASCGQGQNREKILSSATELNWKEVNAQYLANEARAKNEYDGKIVKWTAKIYDIDTDSVCMANETYNGLPLNAIDVCLSNEDLVKLEKYKEITIVGELYLSSFPKIKNAFVVE